MKELQGLRRIIARPEVLSICIVVLTADIVAGIIVPTFSLYLTSLGASMALIGALTGTLGLTSIFVSVPIGMLSDTQGRKNIISGGMLLFALSSFLYTVLPNPLLLFPVRILASLGMVAVFMVGIAYVGDVVPRQERGIALGLYTTGMGIGFTIGPALGGVVAENYGYGASYRIAALIALLGFVVAVRWLANTSQNPARQGFVPTAGAARPAALPIHTKMRIMVREPKLLAASLANLGNNVAFTTMFTFFPLYAAGLSVGDAALGSMFAGRALASTFTRIPTGLLTVRTSSRNLMLVAMVATAAVMVILARTTSPAILVLLLMGDGIAYGMFLTAGQSFVTEVAEESDRGKAVGVYNTAGSIGGAAGPFIMGVFAQWLGLSAVFQITAGLVLVAGTFLWTTRVPRPDMHISDAESPSV